MSFFNPKTFCGCMSLKNGVFLLLTLQLICYIINFVTGSIQFLPIFIISLILVGFGFFGVFKESSTCIQFYVIALIISLLFHGIFDFATISNNATFEIIAILLDIVIIFVLRAFYKEIENRNKPVLQNNNNSTNISAVSITTVPGYDRSFTNYDRSAMNYDRTVMNYDRSAMNYDRSFVNYDRPAMNINVI
ncbi:hypothetical protein BCR32DRAFT_251284 [Anaeromyces robustus]|uniref:Uncharacterized protein n=1 Tax=Anaeromyces robustus TaxID=1754192 RepID=A0A1Y1VS41_9FUNG|nr:hypothetical protein BCR32DRAFT_251284 [Anaeromyces robustus]|eukprot:ORX64110.1 hypothetical protein BCR32DRAFT_251284 [Anaeromyces robustus]